MTLHSPSADVAGGEPSLETAVLWVSPVQVCATDRVADVVGGEPVSVQMRQGGVSPVPVRMRLASFPAPFSAAFSAFSAALHAEQPCAAVPRRARSDARHRRQSPPPLPPPRGSHAASAATTNRAGLSINRAFYK